MPTQEERLSTLEQTIAVLNRGIWDIDHNETMLLGMAVKQDENIREVKSSLAALNEHLNTFEQHVNSHFGALDGHVGALDNQVGHLSRGLTVVLRHLSRGLTVVLRHLS